MLLTCKLIQNGESRLNDEGNATVAIVKSPFKIDHYDRYSKAMMRKQLSTFYYLDHFVEFLNYFTGAMQEQLNNDSREFIRQFGLLPQPAQCLVARAANRKYGGFTVSSMDYEEISDGHQHLQLLVEQGWFVPLWHAESSDIIPTLTRPVLMSVIAEFDVSLVKKSATKTELIAIFDTHATKIKGAVESPKNYYYSRFFPILRYLLFLYFGHVNGRLNQFSMRDLGVMRTRDDVMFESPRFDSTESALSAFYYANQLSQLKTTKALKSKVELTELPKTPCFTSQLLRDQYLFKLGQLALAEDPQYALRCWQMSDLPKSQEKWLRESYKLGNKEDVERCLLSVIDSPSSDSLALFAEDFYQRKFNKKRTSAMTDMLRSSTTELYIDINYKQSVERGVVDYYQRQEQQVFRTENRLWRGLFGLLFWDILYVDNSLVNPFERLPQNLRRNQFYAQQGDEIEDLLNALSTKHCLLLHLTKAAANHYGKANSMFQWRKHLLDPIKVLLEHVTLQQVFAVMRSMAKDYKHYRDGFPDIMCCFNNQLRFEEIKAPGDVLRRNQLVTIKRLQAIGFDVGITQVHWCQDPKQPYAVCDIETTGGRSDTHKITEIAIVIVVDGKVIKQFQSLINPQRRIPNAITRLTGITDNMVKTAPVFSQVAKEVSAITENCVFVAHNVNFDYGFLKQEFARIGEPFRRPKMCTVQQTRKVFPGLTSYSLGNLCKHFEIPLENHHRALDDAKAAAELLMITQQQ